MIRLVASDLDGTLLNASHALDMEEAKCIKEIQKAGIQFVVATGRTYDGAHYLLEPYDIHCDYIVLNGALTKDGKGNIIAEHALCKSTLQQIITLLRNDDAFFHMYSMSGTLTFDAQRGKDTCMRHLMSNGMSMEEARQAITSAHIATYDAEYEDEQAFYKDAVHVYKVEVFCEDACVFTQLCDKLALLSGVHVTSSMRNNIEVTAPQATKGMALAQLCKRQGILKEDVVVIGDSSNDMDMIQSFPNSVAVANAIATLQASARYTTKSNEEHGVALVLNEILQHNGEGFVLKNF